MTVAVIGYASRDHAMAVDALPGPDRTAVVTRLSDPWPGAGGAAHVARALATTHDVELITWIGDDDGGRDYLRRLHDDGVGTTGVATTLAHTPASYLLYDRDGHTLCLFDPGGPATGLTDAQRAVVAGCDWLCITVGPTGPTRAALDALPASAALACVVKGDASAFDPATLRRCLRRAQVLTFSRGEWAFLVEQVAPDDPLALVADGAVVVQTGGAEGIWYRAGGDEGLVPVAPIAVADTTGAGDTFAGRLLAGVVAGTAPGAAVRAAAAATRAFLDRRTGGAAGRGTGTAGATDDPRPQTTEDA